MDSVSSISLGLKYMAGDLEHWANQLEDEGATQGFMMLPLKTARNRAKALREAEAKLLEQRKRIRAADAYIDAMKGSIFDYKELSRAKRRYEGLRDA